MSSVKTEEEIMTLIFEIKALVEPLLEKNKVLAGQLSDIYAAFSGYRIEFEDMDTSNPLVHDCPGEVGEQTFYIGRHIDNPFRAALERALEQIEARGA